MMIQYLLINIKEQKILFKIFIKASSLNVYGLSNHGSMQYNYLLSSAESTKFIGVQL